MILKAAKGFSIYVAFVSLRFDRRVGIALGVLKAYRMGWFPCIGALTVNSASVSLFLNLIELYLFFMMVPRPWRFLTCANGFLLYQDASPQCRFFYHHLIPSPNLSTKHPLSSLPLPNFSNSGNNSVTISS